MSKMKIEKKSSIALDLSALRTAGTYFITNS